MLHVAFDVKKGASSFGHRFGMFFRTFLSSSRAPLEALGRPKELKNHAFSELEKKRK